MPTPNKVAKRTGQITLFTPNRRLFLSWQLIIDSAKARGEASARDIKSYKKWLTRWTGDVKYVDSMRRMSKRLSRQQTTSGKNVDQLDAAIPIIVAFTKNTSLPHQEVCAALLPYVTGWERIFVGELVKITNIGAIRKAKLVAIIEAILENPPRLCRYCSSRVSIVDEYSYSCPKCGNCLNLNWGDEQ